MKVCLCMMRRRSGEEVVDVVVKYILERFDCWPAIVNWNDL